MSMRDFSVVKFLLVVLPFAALSGCAFSPKDNVKITQIGYDPASQARIRVYGLGYSLDKSSCYIEDPDLISKNIADILKITLFMKPESNGIGMPRVPNKGRGIFYEYVITAGAFVAVQNRHAETQQFGNMIQTSTCDPGGVIFMPQAGKDYESAVVLGGGTCKIKLYEIRSDGSLNTDFSVPSVSAVKCAPTK